MDSRLTLAQRRLADEFFAREKRFVLTGGGALCGFLLGHRTTKDLDFFSTEALQDDGDRALRAAANALSLAVELKVSAEGFRRYVMNSATDTVVVDLVHDRAHKGNAPKLHFGAVIVDPPEEILANKLCTLLSRSEPRDLVDVLALDRAGYRVEDAVPLASLKDGGLTPAQLGWVLSQIRIGDDARIPGGYTPQELRAVLGELGERLGKMGWPAG